MIRLYIACDERDTKIGYYCEYCKDRLSDYLSNEQKFSIHNLDSTKTNHIYISNILKDNLSNSIFIAYSHGSETSLLCDSKAYLDEFNSNLFENSIVYAMTCLAGAKLGKELINQGCKVFVGFDKEVIVMEKYKHISERCENWAIALFLLENYTIEEAFNSMKKEFTKQCDSLYKTDYFNSSWLIGNRDALVLYGDGLARIDDFVNVSI